MEEFKVTLQTLTPVWTGNVERKCKDLRLTGLLGSLRWWFEALVRGMGYKACDSTGEKCELKLEKPTDLQSITQKLCPACFLFGTTGWKKRFWVGVEDEDIKQAYDRKIIVEFPQQRGWHYESGLFGRAKLRFLYENYVFLDGTELKGYLPSVLRMLLYFIQEYGMVGAKTALGYGVVRFEEGKNKDSEDKTGLLSVSQEDWGKFNRFLSYFKTKEIRDLPNIKDMFCIKFEVTEDINGVFNKIQEFNNIEKFLKIQNGAVSVELKEWRANSWLITTPFVRKEIRKAIKNKFPQNQPLRHFLMGKVIGQNTKFSAIQVSHIYQNSNNNLEFRIWGWLPKSKCQDKRNEIIKLFSELFNNVPWSKFIPCQITEWGTWENNELKLVKDIKKLLVKR
ncbi:MAG: type III-B CRISPR module RAMP protein Cmr1 [Candidatus Desulfofervidaceae bacterium]|nr:type III-B CRISPR module RAMP protein Cmr1 [Candidatus Desulfofervidaceae bacterium]